MLLRAVLLTFFTGLTIACKCRMSTPKELFCKSDFVGIVNVTNPHLCATPNDNLTSDAQIYRPRDQCYDIEVIEAWKGSCNFNLLKTAESSASCGLSFITPKAYVFSGSGHGRILTGYLCSSYQTPADEADVKSLQKLVDECNSSS